MTTHRFRLGQRVRFGRGFPHRSAAMGEYEVVRQLPPTGENSSTALGVRKSRTSES